MTMIDVAKQKRTGRSQDQADIESRSVGEKWVYRTRAVSHS
jgi:hypothetical protein